MKKKKILALTIAALTMAGMIAGCGSSPAASDEPDQSSVPAAEQEEQAAESGEAVELTMWGGWTGDQIAQLEEQLEGFNSSQDKIHITYMSQDTMEQKLLTAIASNEVPDIVLWDRFNTSVYAPKGALMPLDEYVERDGIDLSQFYEPAVDELRSGDVLYGIPLTVDTRVIFYNKDLLEEAGVDPASITDWNSLEEAAVKLTKWDGSTLVQAGFSLKDAGLFNNWIAQAGGQMIDDTVCVGLFNGTFIKNGGNEDDTARKKLEAFELYRKIRDAKGDVEISTEEATLIKKVAQLLSPGAYGQIYNIIEGKE